MLLNAGRGCEGKYPVCPAEEERVGSPREPEGQAGQQLHCLDPAGRAYLSWVPVWVGPGRVEAGGPAQMGCGMLGYQQGQGQGWASWGRGWNQSLGTWLPPYLSPSEEASTRSEG